MMKSLRILPIILSFVLLLSSCSKETEISYTPVPTPKPTVSATELPLYNPNKPDPGLYIYKVAQAAYQMQPMELDVWSQYIFDKYDVDISFEYIILKYPRPVSVDEYLEADFTADLENLKYTSDFNGFVIYSGYDNLSKLKDLGYIKPVNEYIDDIPAYSLLDPAVFDRVSDSDGNIWALPYTKSIHTPRRAYRTDWLESYGKGAPSTIDEFLEYAYYVKNEDPDGNGIDDTYIATYTDYGLLYYFTDIFRANGCFGERSESIGYNPLENKFMSVTESRGFADAMWLLGYMKKEGLIVEDPDMFNFQDEKDYRLASFYTIGSIPEYFDDFVIAGGLKGNNEEFLLESWGTCNALAVLKDTDEVVEKFNSLVGIASEGTEGYMDLRAGIKGVNYDVFDEYISLYTRNDKGKTMSPLGITVDLGIDGYLLDKPQIQNDIGEIPAESIRGMNVYNQLQEANAEQIENSRFYSTPVVSGGEKILNIKAGVRDMFYELLSDIMSSNNSIAELVEAYNEKLISTGVSDMLDDINKNGD